MSNTSRQEILDKIRKVNRRTQLSIIETEFKNQEIYKPILPDAITCFKAELEAINGRCIIVQNEQELFEKLSDFLSANQLVEVFCRDPHIQSKLTNFGVKHTDNASDFENMLCGVTQCEFLIARTGSVLVSSNGPSGRQMNVFPPIHIIIANSTQIVDYQEDALIAIRQKYAGKLPSAVTTITGPSRTADIEKTLVLGAHGPKELIVFVIQN